MTTLEIGTVRLETIQRVPREADRIVVFAHGAGSSRHSPRNNFVAEKLEAAGVASLLFDLLTEEEDRLNRSRFDIDLLTSRVLGALDAVVSDQATCGMAVHLFGASTGAAAAIRAAVESPHQVTSVVSRGGRPDLAGDALEKLAAPCLMIVGGEDPQVLELNREAAARVAAPHDVKVVEGAGHLFEEPGALDQVADLAVEWFLRYP